jgi:hypothetical protein
MKFVHLTLKNSVPTSQKTDSVSITKTNMLMLFWEIIAVYSSSNTKHIKCTVFKEDDAYNNRSASEG